MSKIKNWRKLKTQDSMDKTNFIFGTLPSSLWAILAAWLHVGAHKKIYEKWTYNPFWTEITILNRNHHFEQKSPWSHTELEFDMLGLPKSLWNM
jgi:hypothetical protein